jgi:hypothetical protein
VVTSVYSDDYHELMWRAANEFRCQDQDANKTPSRTRSAHTIVSMMELTFTVKV